jgi:hypothetical protein
VNPNSRAWLLFPAGVALAPWVLVLAAPHHHHRGYVLAIDAVVVVVSIVMLALVLVGGKSEPDGWQALAAFAIAFVTLVGAFSDLNLIAATTSSRCLISGSGEYLKVDQLDAIYYALTTLTTTGFGDISAHTDTCRRLIVGEMLVGFPALGLAVAGVAARVFRQLNPAPAPTIEESLPVSLERLHGLLTVGALTSEEYDIAKRKLLPGGTSAPPSAPQQKP